MITTFVWHHVVGFEIRSGTGSTVYFESRFTIVCHIGRVRKRTGNTWPLFNSLFPSFDLFGWEMELLHPRIVHNFCAFGFKRRFCKAFFQMDRLITVQLMTNCSRSLLSIRFWTLFFLISSLFLRIWTRRLVYPRRQDFIHGGLCRSRQSGKAKGSIYRH